MLSHTLCAQPFRDSYSYSSIDDGVSFKDCVMDAITLKTLLPSLRVAQAEGKIIDFSRTKIVGDISDLDLSHINFRGANFSEIYWMNRTNIKGATLDETNIPPYMIKKAVREGGTKPDVNEVVIRRRIDRFFTRSFSPKTISNTKFAYLSDALYSSITNLHESKQNIVMHALKHNAALQEFTKTLSSDDSESICTKLIEKIDSDPEFERQYLRDKQEQGLDPFADEILTNLYELSPEERQVLTSIIQEHTEILSQRYDSTKGTPQEKAAILFKEIQRDHRFKYRKRVEEYKPQEEYFSDERIQSMGVLLNEIAPWIFIDTVESDSAKYPPQLFGTTLQKTLCSLFPNIRNLFGTTSKFGHVIASRSFLQICKLIAYSISHPQKMRRTINDSLYVMDQIDGVTWKDPRNIKAAQQELVTKLVQGNVIGGLLKNSRLPVLAFATTHLFPDTHHAKNTIEVGIKFYAALEDTGVIRTFNTLIKGPQKARGKIITPFLAKVINDDLLSQVNQETAEFLADIVNNSIVSKEDTKLTANEILAVVESGKRLFTMLKQYKVVDHIEDLLLKSNAERLEILKRTIDDPNDLAEIIKDINEIQKTIEPIARKAASLWDSAQIETMQGTHLWYGPDQAKLKEAMFAKQTNQDAIVNLNTTFNSCSFGNSSLIGTKDNPINWTNVRAAKFDMWGTTLKHVEMDGSQFTGYTNPVASKWYFKGASFDHAVMEECSLNNVELRYAYMQEVTMKACKADNLDLSNANMMYAALEKSEFTEPSFKSASLHGAYVVDCKIRKGDFSNTNCKHAVFKSTFEGKISFEKADLSNAVFSGSTFEGNVNMRSANLVNAQLDDITLADGSSIDLDGAKVTTEQLNKLQERFPEQIKNADNAIILTESAIRGMSGASTTRSYYSKNSKRIAKALKGRFS